MTNFCFKNNPFLASPTSQLILQPYRCYTYVTAHSPNIVSLLLRHRLFTYVIWRAAHGPQPLTSEIIAHDGMYYCLVNVCDTTYLTFTLDAEIGQHHYKHHGAWLTLHCDCINWWMAHGGNIKAVACIRFLLKHPTPTNHLKISSFSNTSLLVATSSHHLFLVHLPLLQGSTFSGRGPITFFM